MSDNNKLVVGGAILAIACTGLGYALGSMMGEANASGGPVVEEPVARGGPTVSDDAMRQQIEQQKERIEALEDALESKRQVAEVAPEEPTAEPEEEAPPVQEGPYIQSEEFGEALDQIDWQKVGTAMHKMLPLMAAMTEALANGEQPPIELQGQLVELNGTLVRMGTEAVQAGVPGFGVNGTFTHPVMAGNQLAAMLSAAEIPLSDTQQARLQGLVDLYAAEDKNLRISAETHENELQTLMEEVGYKDRFFKDMDGLLSPEQMAALRPSGVKDRIQGDFFSTGLILAQVAQPVPARNRTELVDVSASKFSQTLRLNPEQMPKVRAVLEKWAQGIPDTTFQNPDGRSMSRHSLSKAEVAAAAQRQAQLLQQMRASGALTPEQWASLKDSPRILVPMGRSQ